jgi:small-conductance mechanosensitive channel
MAFLKKLEIKGQAAEVISLLFQSLLVTYLILLLIEQIWGGSVSFYLNMNYLLVVVIIVGVLDVFSKHEKPKKEKVTRRDYIFVSLLGILGFVILKFKTADLGWLSWVISVIAGILIVLLSILVLEEDDEKKESRKPQKTNNYTTPWKPLILYSLLTLTVISLALAFFTALTYPEAFRIVFGSVYVLFLPGFVISYIFFPKTKEFDAEDEDNGKGKSKNEEEKEKGAIDWIERIALSFALSIAIVPLTVFYLNLAGVRINLLNSFLTILGITVVSGVVLRVKSKK